jgi:hypothetical protein
MQLTVNTNKKQGSPVHVDKYPDECPYCHRGIDPTFLNGFRNFENETLHLAFFCPRLDCNNYFIGKYAFGHSDYFYFDHILLGWLKQKGFSQIITDISPDFTEIYRQASIAEQGELDQICGVGYRKALEFLIKDYVIYKDSSLKETVEKILLGKCINDYIKNDRLKDISKRATWLGNDETHYVRKWIGKNITDLKLLIDLTVHWIETENLTDKIILSMPE